MHKFALLIAVVASFAFAGSASAQNRHYSHNHGFHGSYSQGHYHYLPGHYHYHPGGLVPHRDHYHYVPGHYDYHPGRLQYHRGPDVYRGTYGNYGG